MEEILRYVSIPVIFAVNSTTGLIIYTYVYRNSFSTNESSFVKAAISLANCFAAGVFLATCFIGLLPTVLLKFNALRGSGVNIIGDYPLAEAIVISGFFIIWLIDQTVHMCFHSENNDAIGESSDHGLGHSHGDTCIGNGYDDDESPLTAVQNMSVFDADEEADISRSPPVPQSTSTTLVKAILITFALGSHSIIEGVGFGLLDDLTPIVNLLVGIIIHESLCAVSLGLQLGSKSAHPKLAVPLIVTFSSLIPIGIGCGVALSNSETGDGSTGLAVTSTCMGLAAGTFIYVVFIEILPAEMHSRVNRLAKILVTLFGFVCIALLRLLDVGGRSGDRIAARNVTVLGVTRLP